MSDLRDPIQLVADQVADCYHGGAPYDRAQHIPSEEAHERHTCGTRHRPGHEAHAGDESRHEDCLASVGMEKDLEAFVTVPHRRESSDEARDDALAAVAADKEAAAIAGDRAQDAYEVDESEVHIAVAREEAGHQHHGLFGNRNPEVPDEHADENAQVTPVAQIAEPIDDVRRVQQFMHQIPRRNRSYPFSAPQS